MGGVPHTIKANDGIEHALIEPVHIYLCSINEEEGIENAFSIATSPQRFLQDLSDNDMLDTSDLVILDCVRFSFTDLIRHDLNRTKNEWDSHIISRGRNWGQSGKPTCMYNLSHLYDVHDYLHDADLEEVQEFRGVVDIAPFADYSTEFKEFSEYLMEEDGLEPPSNPTEVFLYTYLLQKVEEYSQLLTLYKTS